MLRKLFATEDSTATALLRFVLGVVVLRAWRSEDVGLAGLDSPEPWACLRDTCTFPHRSPFLR